MNSHSIKISKWINLFIASKVHNASKNGIKIVKLPKYIP